MEGQVMAAPRKDPLHVVAVSVFRDLSGDVQRESPLWSAAAGVEMRETWSFYCSRRSSEDLDQADSLRCVDVAHLGAGRLGRNDNSLVHSEGLKIVL
jgi:hypothetical protein